jgi:dipeptidyl aminopeptidase/acylaminoacyl peptidase
MRLPIAALAAVIAGGVSLQETRDLVDALPVGTAPSNQVAITADGKRTYFVNPAGQALLYERAGQSVTLLTAGPLWDLNLSPAGTAIAYTKAGEHRGDQYVWALTLDPSTGLARGAERRLSAQQGDVPSIAPDGKLVAFARDDDTGVGQTIVVVPINGGTERVVTRIPSSAANIRWTPDGKTLFVGVNPPVACVPEWSCLPLTPDLRQPPGTIRRVSASGGDATVVATTRGLLPGLSPAGTTLFYGDTTAPRRYVVANANGTPRQTVELQETPIGWLDDSTVLLISSGPNGRLRTMSLAGKRP